MSRNSSPSHSRRESTNSFSNSNSNSNSFRPRPSGVPSSSGPGGNLTGNPTGGGGGGGGSRLNPSRGPSPGFQTPPNSTTNTMTIGPPRNIGLLLGCPIKLKLVGAAGTGVSGGTNSNDRWVEGKVWCYDPLPGVIVLECSAGGSSSSSNHTDLSGKGKQTYRMIKMNQIKEVQIGDKSNMDKIESSTTTSSIVNKILEPLKPININAVELREATAIKNDDARRARIGYGVSRWGQEIFDALGKTLPVRWHQTSIVILDDVLLPGPLYRPEDAKSNNNEARLNRVRMVLEGERIRLTSTEEGKSMEKEAIRLSRTNQQTT
ncbi:anticodon-binding domain-containing protein [Melampsora americana]|nr:anticodon-binding domain-containing protein [Melampsora americana]